MLRKGRLSAFVCLCGAFFAGSLPAAVGVKLGTYASVLGSTSGSSSDVVSAPSSWIASSGASWIHFTNASAPGSGLATFNYDANVGATRTATITVSNGGSTAILTLTQAGANFTASTRTTQLVSSNLNEPKGIALDSSGNVYIADYNDGAVKVWNSVTLQMTTLVSCSPCTPTPVALDSSGNVYFTDDSNQTLTEWNASTRQATVQVSTGLGAPEGVAIDPSGNVYIADEANRTIYLWNPTTKQLGPFLSTGASSSPRGLAVDGTGNLYVADAIFGTVKEWNASGQHTLFSGLGTPAGLAVDGAGNVYVTDFNNPTNGNGIKAWNAVNQQLTTLVAGLASFGVAVDPSGAVYFTDVNAGLLEKYVAASGATAETAQVVGPSAGSSSVALATLPLGANLAWTASTTTNWLHLNAGSGFTFSPALFTYDANPGATRTGTISFNNGATALTITQAGANYLK